MLSGLERLRRFLLFVDFLGISPGLAWSGGIY